VSTATDILSRFAAELERFVKPLVLVGIDQGVRQEVFDCLGWDLSALTGFPADQLVSDIATIAQMASDLAESAKNGLDSFDNIAPLLGDIGAIFDAVRNFSQLAQNASLNVSADAKAALAKLGEDLLQFLAVDYLDRCHPAFLHAARLLMLVESYGDGTTFETAVGGDGGSPVVRRSTRLARVRFDRLPALLQDPIKALRDEYLGANALATVDDARDTAGRLFDRLGALAAAFGAGISDGSDTAGADTRDAGRALAIRFGFPADGAVASVGAVLSLLADTEGGAGLVIEPTGWVTTGWEFRNWLLSLNLSAEAVSLTIRPSGVTLPSATPAFEIQASLERQSDGTTPAVLIGAPQGTRLEIGSVTVSAKFQASNAGWDLDIGTALKTCSIVVAAGQGDGFLAKVLPADGISVQFDFAIGWSRSKGVYFGNGTALELELPLHLSLGPVTIETIYIAIKLNTDGSIGLALAATVGIELGPVSGEVDRLGIKSDISFPQGGGNLGPLEFGLGFKPPDGVGLEIDAGPVSGGGYISFDAAAGRYAGILQLTLPVLSITVIGLLDTKLPGGQEGYSFLLIVACDFPPIQLGYGFVLTGLGGLAGINRTIVVQALQDGVHTGSVDHILFPVDPVAHATQLISDLETIFPPTQGDYVFGPMAELGWGEPDPLITAELGIILTLPDPVVIVLLGKVEVLLPDPDDPVVELRMEVAGSLDLTNSLLAIDTTLRDSRILAFTISGDTALRLAFGAQPSFLFAMGGFNPHFQPPANVRTLQRMAISLGTGENPRVAMETYVAITSNTFQIGAKATANIAYGDFKASGDLGFDALFHFQPFSFRVDVEADVAVTGPFGFSASVHLDATLSGPDPTRITGMLVLHCLGTHSLPIDIPFGQPAVVKPITPLNPWPQLQTEIGRGGNWSASFPEDSQTIAVLARSQGSDSLAFIDPAGGLTLRQKTLPLDRTIDKFGEGRLAAPVQFGISSVSLGTLLYGKNSPLAKGSLPPVSGPFAAAQFEQMSDAQQLSRPSFEPMNAGVSIASDVVAFGPSRGRDYAYATLVVDAPTPAKRYTPGAAAQMAAHLGGPAARAPSQTTGMRKYAPPPNQPPAARMARAGYVIADVATLTDSTAVLASNSVPVPDPPEKGAMMRALVSYYAVVPADRGKYAVMGAWELT
jgi:hypothetical protein